MGSCMKSGNKSMLDSKQRLQYSKNNLAHLAFHRAKYSSLNNSFCEFQNTNQHQNSAKQSSQSKVSIEMSKRSLKNKNQKNNYRQSFNQSQNLSVSYISQAQSIITIINNDKFDKKLQQQSDIISYGKQKIVSQLKAQGLRNDKISSFIESLANPIQSQISDALNTLSDIQLDRLNQLINGVNFIHKNPMQKFQFKKQVGKGGGCVVYQTKTKDSYCKQQTYAVKILSPITTEKVKKIKLQIAIMTLFQSNNIVKFNFAYLFKDRYYIFMEHIVHGSLTNLLKKVKQIHCQAQNQSPTIFAEKFIAYILRQILIGIEQIHLVGVVHRDIKSDNILIGEDGCVKIGDFGHATLAFQQYLNIDEPVGTPAWMAPQLIKKSGYNEKVDIWSIGIVAIQLCLGEPPYLRLNPIKSMYMTVTQQSPKVKGISQLFQNFMSQCLQKNPNQRPSAYQLLNHPFIRKGQLNISQRQEFNLLLRLSDRPSSLL